MLLTLWTNYWEDWELGHRVVFDGPNREILIDPSVTVLEVENDIYSSWKEWVMIRDNSKYLHAFGTAAGDPLPGGDFLGGTFFLENDWKIRIGHQVTIEGNIYDRAGGSAFIIEDGGGVVNRVSNLVDKVTPDLNNINVDGLTLEEALIVITSVLAGKMQVTPTGATSSEVKFYKRDGTTDVVTGTVDSGVRTASDVEEDNL